MYNDLTPIERNKKKTKALTWVLSISTILLVSVIVYAIS